MKVIFKVQSKPSLLSQDLKDHYFDLMDNSEDENSLIIRVKNLTPGYKGFDRIPDKSISIDEYFRYKQVPALEISKFDLFLFGKKELKDQLNFIDELESWEDYLPDNYKIKIKGDYCLIPLSFLNEISNEDFSKIKGHVDKTYEKFGMLQGLQMDKKHLFESHDCVLWSERENIIYKNIFSDDLAIEN